MQLIDWAFLLFFVFSGILFIWFILVGGLMTYFTPKSVVEFAFTSKHYTPVELSVVRGFHFVALIHGVALLTAVTFPKWATKRQLTQIRTVCPRIFINLSVVYIYVLWSLMILIMICCAIWVSMA